MKVELKEPFLEEYKAAYVNTNKEPRRVCLLVRKDGSQTSMSYARYLMSCHLGRFLSKEEHVDHIDNDRMNDIISNYQLLTITENNRKSARPKGSNVLVCPICNKTFVRTNRQIYGKTNMACSRKCGYVKTSMKLSKSK